MGKRVMYTGNLLAYAGLRGELLGYPSSDTMLVLWDNGKEVIHSAENILFTHADDAPRHTDPVNQPQHYRFFPDLEAIEVIARSTTQEQFYGYCLGNRLKYRLRAGNKDKLEQDIAKSDKYLELYEKYKGLCYGAAETVIAPVPMPNLEDW